MTITEKNIKRLDVNLFSGSSDSLRTELGVYYYVTSSDAGEHILFNELVDELPDMNFDVFNDVTAHETLSDNIFATQVNWNIATTASSGIPIANHRVPVRLIGEEPTILTDEMWKIMLLGGEYGDKNYNPIFSQATFDDYSFEYGEPYSLLESKTLAKKSLMINSFSDLSFYDIGYKYNTHLPKYEAKASQMGELLLPNIYMMTMVDNSENPETEFPAYMRNFVSVEGLYPDIIAGIADSSLFDKRLLEYPPPRSTATMEEDEDNPGTYLYEDRNANLREYLTGAFAAGEYSNETKSEILSKTSTLFYDSQFLNDNIQTGWTNRNKIPLYTMIKFPVVSSPFLLFGGPYSRIISNHNLEEELLMHLRNANFGDDKQQYIKESTLLDVSDEITSNKTTSENSTVNKIDFMSMLYKFYSTAQQDRELDGLLMGKQTLERLSAQNPGSNYRYHKTISALKAIQDATNLMNTSKISRFNTLTGNDNLSTILDHLHKFVGSPETIAYRIEKIGGTLTGPIQSTTSIQNMYFANDNDDSLKSDGSNFVYTDTQVKMGQEYIYTMYAYVLVPGYQYRYSDLRISRNIGRVLKKDQSGEFEITSDSEDHCLEFYNPATNIAASQLLNDKTNLMGTTYSAVYNDETNGAFKKALAGSGPYSDALLMRDIFPDLYADVNYSAYTEEDRAAHTATPGGTEVAHYLMGLDSSIVKEVSDALQAQWSLINITTTDDDNKTVTLAEQNENRYASNAQIKSQNKYLADFYLDIMHNVKIIEVPVATKVLTIQDNPPVAPDVTPYQRKDNSQIIGFYVNVESFRLPMDPTNTESASRVGMYPTPINNKEAKKKSSYLSSNNMLDDELVEFNSVSKPSNLEIYRLDRPPKSLSDFNGHLVHNKSLAMPQNPDHKYTNCFYEERINTNKKYYYLLRFLNEHGDAGYIAPVQVVELIEDGGYKYSVFDVIYETELEKPDEQQDSIMFKKLMQITPSMNHTVIDDTDLDYTQPASSQLDKLDGKVGTAESLIWGKTFKFRITSKKTGKKVDLNIKYNLRDS